jgi:uncharacterized protein YdhG (YjbR/CyaY superfamily)
MRESDLSGFPLKVKPKSIDDYISGFPPEIQTILQRIRSIIHKMAPPVTEKISYGIPTLVLRGGTVHFAAFKSHIGLYPPVRGDATLVKEASVYAGEKGNLKFHLDEPIPYALIGKIARARAQNAGGTPSKRRTRK